MIKKLIHSQADGAICENKIYLLRLPVIDERHSRTQAQKNHHTNIKCGRNIRKERTKRMILIHKTP